MSAFAMDPEVETKHATAVESAVQSIYKTMFPGGDMGFVPEAFRWTIQCFNGHYSDYQAVDARYHDLEHTLQGTLCLARLLHGYRAACAQPMLTQRAFELGLVAILLHDTGYLKRKADVEGTGAKYTLTHVARSVAFAEKLLRENEFSEVEIAAVRNMIRCTGVNADLKSVSFQNELEKRVGFALGTADLLGQMAARDYIDKLPILYSEFAESSQFNTTGTPPFVSALDLMQKTPEFWERFVLPKIVNEFENMHLYLSSPYPEGPNFYLRRIEANIARLRNVLANWSA